MAHSLPQRNGREVGLSVGLTFGLLKRRCVPQEDLDHEK